MKRVMIGCAFVLGLSWVAPALAEDELDCTDPQTQHDMNMCANEDFEKADKELNEVWKKAREHAKAVDADQWDDSLRGAEKALLTAQRGWIPYRDGSCELYGFEARGGSMEPMLVAGCKATMTKARTKELQDFIAGPQ